MESDDENYSDDNGLEDGKNPGSEDYLSPNVLLAGHEEYEAEGRMMDASDSDNSDTPTRKRKRSMAPHGAPADFFEPPLSDAPRSPGSPGAPQRRRFSFSTPVPSGSIMPNASGPMDVEAAYEPMPLFERYTGGEEDTESGWCFLCNINIDSSSKGRLEELQTLVSDISNKNSDMRGTGVGLIHEYYNTFIRPLVNDRRAWTKNDIYTHMTLHDRSDQSMKRHIVNVLYEMFVNIESNQLKKRHKITGETILDTRTVHLLRMLGKDIYDKLQISK